MIPLRLISWLLMLHCTIVCAVLGAEDGPSKSLQRVLALAQSHIDKEESGEAIAALQAWSKKDHSFRQLLLGRSYALGNQAEAAIAAYEQALVLDPEYRDAALLLAEQYYIQQHWAKLCQLLAPWIDMHLLKQNDKKLLQLYAVAAYEHKDYRLAEQLVKNAIIRFPSEREFRNLDVQLLMQRELWQQAASEVTNLLRNTNPDMRLWQHLAFIQQQREDKDGYVAAVEAAYILDSENPQRIRDHAQAQLSVGHIHEASIHLRSLCVPIMKSSSALLSVDDIELLRMCMHSAQLLKDVALALQYLQRIPEQQRDQEFRLQALRLRVEAGQKEAAVAAIEAIINGHGQTDIHKKHNKYNNSADILLWAAQLAESIEAYPQAEIMYQLCRSKTAAADLSASTRAKASATRWRKIANLYLARLLSSQHRNAEAIVILQEHLKEWPDDSYALRLQKMLR